MKLVYLRYKNQFRLISKAINFFKTNVADNFFRERKNLEKEEKDKEEETAERKTKIVCVYIKNASCFTVVLEEET